jgi:hypothetical protein
MMGTSKNSVIKRFRHCLVNKSFLDIRRSFGFMLKIKKNAALLLVWALAVGSSGCRSEESDIGLASDVAVSEVEVLVSVTEKEEADLEMVVGQAESEVSTVEFSVKNSHEEKSASQIWREYLDERIKFAEKVLVADINYDGINELVWVDKYDTEFAFFNNNAIKVLRSNQNWGDGCPNGGMPFYYNELTDEIMTIDSRSGYCKYGFYAFIGGDYQLSRELVWRELRIPWSESRLAELPWLDEWLEDNNETFEEFVDGALGTGFYDRVNKYTIDGVEVSEEQWQTTIDEFINASGCFTLCPLNTFLSYVDLEDVNGDFYAYIEGKLFD